MTVKYNVTSHARDRLRQRYGIETLSAAQLFIADKLRTSKRTEQQEAGKVRHMCEGIDIVVNGINIVTVIPHVACTSIMDEVKGLITRRLNEAERSLRKAEIAVAEITLNMLKARNPVIKEKLATKLSKAIDEQQRLEDRVRQIKKAKKHNDEWQGA